MIKECRIKFGTKDYLIKKSYRSLLEFEDLTGKAITEMGETLKDMLTLFYCIVKVNNQTDLTYNDFIDLVDEHPQTLDEFNQYIVDSAEILKETPVKKKK